MTCEGGVAGLDMRVPVNVAARIQHRGALTGLNVNSSRFQQSGNEYRSLDYDSAENKVDIHVQMGVGSVTIQ